MTNDDDELDRRLRGALSRPRPADRVDTDEFLARVHHGARVRRVKRGVSIAAAGVLAVAGGGLAINATGYLGGSNTPAAAGHTTPSTDLGTFSSTALPPTTAMPSHSEESSPTTKPFTGAVTISANSFIAAGDVHPVSLTATGTMHQWVLASTPGADCGRPACATVFSTDLHGASGSWTDVGQLPAPPATSGNPASDSVSQLRFAKRTDGSAVYDGWAYGNALWSTHDSGNTWSAAQAPPGQVTQLESWGDYVYAGVSSPVAGDDTATLYRSPATQDAWEPVKVGSKGLTSVESLAAANGVVGLIDSRGLHSVLYLSADGLTWQRQRACPAGTDPQALSTASRTIDPLTTMGSLWVTCSSLTSTVIRFTDTTALGSWHSVLKDSFPRTVTVAARTPTTAFVAGASVTGITMVSASKPPTLVPATGFGAPLFFGFTNETNGYLLDSNGNIVSTTDGGATWSTYAVSDTQP
jgi:photosystem II stability/assembly factor-like uncharacterized protein